MLERGFPAVNLAAANAYYSDGKTDLIIGFSESFAETAAKVDAVPAPKRIYRRRDVKSLEAL